MNELDVLLCLFYAATDGEKALVKRAKQLRAKLNHRFNPLVFKNIIEAMDPIAMVNSTIDNYLSAQTEPVEDLTYHGIAQINTEYIYIHLDIEDNDTQFAIENEQDVLELIAIKVTENAGLLHAMVNVKLYKQFGYSGLVHQYEIGDMDAYRNKNKAA